ncbi:ATP-binding protein [Mesorhizobium sp. PAMC28654]|uniref:ATP-dependent nuclease n=1 Tax=Mesorhizobium sp. PAMC28654 TaxID=2880934 RepID=UPI001D0BA1D9|nr:ATP-binding protein [Mesorhizobium sp. PAMC28654]UDL87307.1 ATP-binding protein [Mesorhizobium sp. PAMC28654]
MTKISQFIDIRDVAKESFGSAMLIEELKFKLGASPGGAPLVLNSPTCTVFVGPNNSGKSVVLREIAQSCSDGRPSANLILDEIRFKPHDADEAKAIFDAWKVEPDPGQGVNPTNAILKHGPWRAELHIPHFLEALRAPNAPDHRRQHYANYYASRFLLNLDGPSRINLVNPQDRGNLKDPSSSFARIFTDDPRRTKIREVLYDAFGLYLGIDMSEASYLGLRYGESPPPPERRVEDETLDWMSRARNINQMSDGVKAFTGILIELRAGDPRVIVIDEPEAFLHPALAFKLGKEIARTADEVGKHVFVSTHSPQFLMGAIQSGAAVNVVRLTYRDGAGSARMLGNTDVRAMMLDPLLRSANALAGVFYESVLVAEADADRAFYQEINERLVELSPDRGSPNTLFLNANGKDSVHRIVGPLRKLGIPVAAVLDIDALNPETKLQSILEACGYPKPFNHVLQQRGETWKALIDTGESPKSEGGISLVQGQDLEKAENLLDALDKYGLFVLRHGEVEHWLPTLEVRRNKKWLHEVFEALGSDPKSQTYVRPSTGDVWSFLDKVAAWLKDKNRRGIHAPEVQSAVTIESDHPVAG